jgi:signal peptidase II
LKVLFVSLAVVIIDQLSKLIVKGFSIPFLKIYYSGMYQGQSIQVIGNFFRITFIENPGMAFGFDPGLNLKLWVSLFSLMASIALLVYLYYVRNKSLSLRLAIAFVLGGALGNMIDRVFYGVFYNYAPLFYGRVVDFLDFNFVRFSLFGRSFDRWPIFNFADASVTIGVFILIFFYPHNKSEEHSPARIDSEAVRNDNGKNIESVESQQEKKEDYKNVKNNNGENLPDKSS